MAGVKAMTAVSKMTSAISKIIFPKHPIKLVSNKWIRFSECFFNTSFLFFLNTLESVQSKHVVLDNSLHLYLVRFLWLPSGFLVTTGGDNE